MYECGDNLMPNVVGWITLLGLCGIDKDTSPAVNTVTNIHSTTQQRNTHAHKGLNTIGNQKGYSLPGTNIAILLPFKRI